MTHLIALILCGSQQKIQQSLPVHFQYLWFVTMFLVPPSSWFINHCSKPSTSVLKVWHMNHCCQLLQTNHKGSCQLCCNNQTIKSLYYNFSYLCDIISTVNSATQIRLYIWSVDEHANSVWLNDLIHCTILLENISAKPVCYKNQKLILYIYVIWEESNMWICIDRCWFDLEK